MVYDFGFVPVPKRLYHDPARPANFGLFLNIMFGIVSTVVTANLYYSQPLLIELAQSFDVSYESISRVPTLVQGGYGAGLLLLAPMGDLTRRRPLVLASLIAGTGLTVGLAVTRSLIVFEALSFLIGMAGIAPNVLIPLTADMAPPKRRATAISIVFSGVLLGILLARVVAGIVAQYVTWRVVFYAAIGAQTFCIIIMWAFLPDYPASKDKDRTYFKILSSMARLAVREPTVIQGYLCHIGAAVAFTDFWVTLTFLLGDTPYHYDTLTVGLFGVIGMVGVLGAPLFGRIIDRVNPWYAIVTATTIMLLSKALYWGAAGVNLAVVVIVCIGLDIARQSQQVAIATQVFQVEEGMRSRINSLCIFATFIGQVVGSAVGSEVFLQYGWRANGALMFAFCVFQLAIMLYRGPHVRRYTWFGYEGGLDWRKAAHSTTTTVVDHDSEKGDADPEIR
ncbi:MFS general substrate transporter [Peniophora sp. CONT]|nr:MFS general substrate transporter [Peniophora sp. CONT]